MPSSCNTELFTDVLGKHNWARKFYIFLTHSLLLKNNIIRREINKCGRRKKHVQHVLYPGFGMGQLLGMFSRFRGKFNVLALDKNMKMVTQSTAYFKNQSIHNVYCRSEDISEFKCKDAFDLCMSINLLNYIENDRQALRVMYDALKKPGMLLIFNSSNYADDNASKLNIGVYNDKKYRNGYGILEMRQLLKEIGFSKVNARYVYGNPGILSWKMTTAWPTRMIKTSKLFFGILPFYTLICIPFVLICNFLDINMKHNKGKCILVRAFK
jgi:SAM-dependent methyltransferase